MPAQSHYTKVVTKLYWSLLQSCFTVLQNEICCLGQDSFVQIELMACQSADFNEVIYIKWHLLGYN